MSKFNIYWGLTVVLAFAGMILLFTYDSAFATERGLENEQLLAGGITIFAALLALAKAATLRGGGGEQDT